MATVTKPMALDESIHTTDGNDTNIADLMQNGLAAIAAAVGAIPTPTAANVSFDDSQAGLGESNVQGAIEALNDNLANLTNLNDYYAITSFLNGWTGRVMVQRIGHSAVLVSGFLNGSNATNNIFASANYGTGIPLQEDGWALYSASQSSGGEISFYNNGSQWYATADTSVYTGSLTFGAIAYNYIA